MNNNIYYHVTTKDNYLSMLNMGCIQPMIGHHSQLANEMKPKIYLFATYDDATNAVMNWLGDQFDDEIELVCIALQLPYTLPKVAFEYQCAQPITINHIKKVYYNF